MTFLNHFHKQVTERKMRKIAESQQSPMSSADLVRDAVPRHVLVGRDGHIFVVDAEFKPLNISVTDARYSG